jgi:hypothetical protein
MRIPFAFIQTAAAPGGENHLDVDFSALANGGHSAASFLTDTRLTFERNSVGTVQTSASAITSGIAADYARVGSKDGSSKGLVMEPGALLSDQGVGYNPRTLTGGGLNAGDATRTANAATGPDGTASAATQINASSGQYGPYFGPVTDGAYEWSHSSWQRSVVADDMQQVYNINAVVNTGGAVTSAGSTTWRRIFQRIASAAGNNKYSTSVDARDYSSVGGQAATARNVYVDYYLGSRQVFATEAYVNDCEADRIYYSAVQDLISSDELRVEYAFRPLHDAVDPVYHTGGAFGAPVAQTYYYLWRVDSTHYCRIVASSMKVEIKNGGSTYTSTYAIDWEADDLVELFVTSGDGGVPVVTVRLNSGTPYSLGGSGTIGAWSSTGQIDFCCDTTESTVANDFSVVCARHVRLKTYAAASSPAWISGAADWTPALLTASLLLLPDYSGSPWAGTASAGASSGRSMTEATNPPATSAAINGHTVPDFDGTNDVLAAGVASDTVFSTVGSFAALIYPTATPASSGAGSRYNDGTVFADPTNAEATFGFTADGIVAVILDNTVTYNEMAIAASQDAWNLMQFTWDGSYLRGRKNKGAYATPVACGPLTTITPSNPRSGLGYGGSRFTGRIAMIITSASVWSTVANTNIAAYAETIFGISL